jgi:MYXO-CTERM domain-containing protein
MAGRFVGAVGVAALLLALAPLHGARGAEWHVKPSGSSSGNGSALSPWDLRTALGGGGGKVGAGDTIWVHGGLYLNPADGKDEIPWTSSIAGTSSQPIKVRAYPGEHPVLDGASSQQNDILYVDGSHVWFWGLEIFSSSTKRYSASGGSFPPTSEIDRGTCIGVTQDHTIAGLKFINCILHDGFVGYGNTSATSTSAELYGSVVYNNGWDASDRPHGHNLYLQNVAGNVRAQNANVIWGAFENLVQAYGTHNTDDFSFDSNIVFGPEGGGFLVGGALVSNNLVLTNNCFYSDTVTAPLLDLGWHGYGAGLHNALVQKNTILGKCEIYFTGVGTADNTITGNTIYYAYQEGVVPSQWPGNTWLSSLPSGQQVVVIPNQYEAGRANIAIYNWTATSSVSVDLSSVLKTGDRYEVIDAQNPSAMTASGTYAGPAVVASGTYSGPLSLPMTGLKAAQPVARGTRAHTGSEFGAFIVTGSPADGGVHADGGRDTGAGHADRGGGDGPRDGHPPARDGGPDSGGVDSGAPRTLGAGCGCRTDDDGRPGPAWALVLVLGLLVRRRRR